MIKDLKPYVVSGPGIKCGMLPLSPIDEQEAIGRFFAPWTRKSAASSATNDS